MKSSSGVIFQRIFNKITMTFVVMVFVFCCAGAESSAIRFKDIEVKPEFFDAPSSKYSGVSMNFAPKNKFENKWLVVRVTYQTPSEKVMPRRGAVRGGTRRVPINAWLDDVNLSMRVLMRTGLSRNSRDIYALFTGECSFWTVRMDGKEHVALMCVPAQLLDRFSLSQNVRPEATRRSNRSAKVSNRGVQSSGKRGARDFVIEVVFTSKGRELGRGYYNAGKGRDAAKSRYFNGLVSSVGAEMSFKGSVLSRANSPWALFEPGNFDVEKMSKGENR